MKGKSKPTIIYWFARRAMLDSESFLLRSLFARLRLNGVAPVFVGVLLITAVTLHHTTAVAVICGIPLFMVCIKLSLRFGWKLIEDMLR